MTRSRNDTDSFLRQMDSIVDPSVRTARFYDFFRNAAASEAHRVVASFVSGAEVGAPLHRRALLHACQALHAAEFASIRMDVVDHAARVAQYAIVYMFRDEVRDARHEPSAGGPRDQMPLGARKSRARRARGNDIVAVARDPHPAVIEVLLDNPNFKESDAVRLAASRPARDSHTLVLFHHRRWLSHYAVQNAIAKNPETPSALAHCLLYQLRAPDLRQIAIVEAFDQNVRLSARSLLQARAATAGDEVAH